MQRYLADQPDAKGVRFGVKKMGCSGWAHYVEIVNQFGADDSIATINGVQIGVDPVSFPVVDGTCIDFAQVGINQQFVFDNPNAAQSCGCGESFTVEAA